MFLERQGKFLNLWELFSPIILFLTFQSNKFVRRKIQLEFLYFLFFWIFVLNFGNEKSWRERHSQADLKSPKGRHQLVGAWRAPWLLVEYIWKCQILQKITPTRNVFQFYTQMNQDLYLGRTSISCIYIYIWGGAVFLTLVSFCRKGLMSSAMVSRCFASAFTNVFFRKCSQLMDQLQSFFLTVIRKIRWKLRLAIW